MNILALIPVILRRASRGPDTPGVYDGSGDLSEGRGYLHIESAGTAHVCF